MNFGRQSLGAYGLGRRGIGLVQNRPRSRSIAQRSIWDLRDAQNIFAAEPTLLGGIWLPDLAMMKQDSTGQTNAAGGAVVGLVYDQSKGLALGPELVLNGTFNTNTGWTNLGAAENVIENGKLNCTASLVFYAYDIEYTNGELFLVSVDIDRVSGSIRGQIGSSASIVFPMSASGRYLFVIQGVATGHYFALYGANYVGTVDNVSCKRLLGYSAYQPTTANKPILINNNAKYWFTKDSANTSLPATFPSSLGNNCTVYRGLSTGVSALTGQTIATTYDLASSEWYGSIILNRAASPYEDRLFRRILSRYTQI